MSDNADILARRSSPKEHEEARKAEGTGLKKPQKIPQQNNGYDNS